MLSGLALIPCNCAMSARANPLDTCGISFEEAKQNLAVEFTSLTEQLKGRRFAHRRYV